MPFSATAKFPASVALVSDLLNHQNRNAALSLPALASSMLAGDTSFTLIIGTGAQFPGDDFVVTIDNEIIFVGSRSGDVCSSLTRGYEGTSASGHSSGAPVQAFVTALAHNQAVAEVNAIEAQLGTNLYNVYGTNIVAVSTIGNMSDANSIERVTTGASTITRTLPTAVGRQNKVFTIKKVDSGSGQVTIATTSGQTIDGQTTWTLINQYQFITVISNGANWDIIGQN